jgi:hypothetical protein
VTCRAVDNRTGRVLDGRLLLRRACYSYGALGGRVYRLDPAAPLLGGDGDQEQSDRNQ